MRSRDEEGRGEGAWEADPAMPRPRPLRWDPGRMNEALRIKSFLFLPVLGAARRLGARVRAWETKDRRLGIVTVELRHAVFSVAVEVVDERSRPVSPARLLRRVHRLLDAARRVRGDMVHYVALSSHSRLSSGSRRLARRLRRDRVVVGDWRRLRLELARYVQRRLDALVRAIRSAGKKIFGSYVELPMFLLYVLENVDELAAGEIRERLLAVIE